MKHPIEIFIFQQYNKETVKTQQNPNKSTRKSMLKPRLKSHVQIQITKPEQEKNLQKSVTKYQILWQIKYMQNKYWSIKKKLPIKHHLSPLRISPNPSATKSTNPIFLTTKSLFFLFFFLPPLPLHGNDSFDGKKRNSLSYPSPWSFLFLLFRSRCNKDGTGFRGNWSVREGKMENLEMWRQEISRGEKKSG